MKQIFTFLAFVISLSAFAQNSNLIVFNNSGQQFFVVLNGIKQNSLPKTNVKIEGLVPSAYKVKLIFADGKTGDIDKNIYLEPNMEYSAQVVIKNSKKRKLKLFNMVALNASPYGAGSETITYRPNEGAVFSDGTTGSGTVNVNTSGTHTHADGTVHDANHNVVSNTATIGHSSTSNTGTHTHADGTVHDANHNVVSNTSVTGHSSTVNTGTHTHADGTVHDHNHKPVNTGNTMRQPDGAGTVGEAIVNANGTLTCNNSLNNIDYLIQGIKAKSFSSDQMDLVKNELKTKCINSDQAYRIVNSFTFDGDKIAMAKYCYDHMTDKNNASKLLDLFQFSSSKEELKKYFGK